uniref:Uncharacterized protein n=1 Tax=Ignisphaera aggregans TaxID=334771 RepID=A0A7J3Z8M6_9CREN
MLGDNIKISAYERSLVEKITEVDEKRSRARGYTYPYTVGTLGMTMKPLSRLYTAITVKSLNVNEVARD